MPRFLARIMIAIMFASFIGINFAQGASCAAKEHSIAEYFQWKKSYQKFLSQYEKLDSSERFEQSKNSIKIALEKMKALAEKTQVPLPLSTFTHAQGLVNEIEAGRMARVTAIPILKSSLKALKNSMEEMILKAKWINSKCNIT